MKYTWQIPQVLDRPAYYLYMFGNATPIFVH